ncbi:MAG: hypothetical protein UU76_C0008G0010 [Parcubacteria group bacterium GW2011_GWC1_41_7]|nr:MAG: hypothetical protein UU76_C0008G0010 [Parcubacteria group bacterium GW2011_GWC1_41_7]
MISSKKSSSFTLIEVSIVLLIVGILAGIVMRQMGGFGIKTRDARRVQDLKTLEIYLSQYITQHGFLPRIGDSSHLTFNKETGYLELERVLANVGIAGVIPKDPLRGVGGNGYQYLSCVTNGASMTGAELETALNSPTHYLVSSYMEQGDPDASIWEGALDYKTNMKSMDGWACWHYNHIDIFTYYPSTGETRAGGAAGWSCGAYSASFSYNQYCRTN